MPKAIFNETVLAESDDTVVVEGNHYFPRESLAERHFRPSDRQTTCPWKGKASYLTVDTGDQVATDAAWYYPDPKSRAEHIRGRVAFSGKVRVEA
jgi:uncharacterized protein (DUF427 family)